MRKMITGIILIAALLISMYTATIPLRTSAAKPGIVYTKGTEFVLDGYPFYFAGCNSYDLFTKSQSEIDKRMSDMDAAGIKVVRTWGFSHEDWHGFEPKKGEYSEEQFRLFDYIMKSAAAHGIKIIITLENYWEAYGGIDDRLAWEGLPGVSHENRAKFYTNPGCKAGYMRYIQHFVTRTNYYTGIPYAKDPAIFAWELMNEPRYQDAGENSTGTTLRKWIDEMGGFIKSLDPNHMVSCGIEGHESKYGFGGDEGNPFVYLQQSPYIDFCTAHPYPDEKWAGLSVEQAAELVEKWIDDAHNKVGKPFVLEEFNTHDNKKEYWTAMYAEIEEHNAAGDNFWNFNDNSTSNFDILNGDPLLSTVFKKHAENMAAKNKVWVHKPLDFKQLAPGADLSGVLPKVVFSWEDAVGANSYNLVVSEDSDYLKPTISVIGLKTTQYTLLKSLKFGTKYYWKVEAVNILGSTNASNSGIAFTTREEPTAGPGYFTLKEPVNETVGETLRPTFKWSDSKDALSYTLFVCTDGNMSDDVINTSVIGNTYTPDKDLELDKTYYWCVNAVNNVGSVLAAGVFKFKTIDLPPVNTTAKVMAAINGSSTQEVQYKIVVANTGAGSMDKFTARIFMDITEIVNEGYSDKDITVEKLYDQTGGKATFSGPKVWDADKNIYYVEINWNDYVLSENATIEMDARIRLNSWASVIKAENDYSFKGLGSAFKDTEYIPLYRGNLKMWGNNPQVITPTPFPKPKLYGYIAPDFSYSEAAGPFIKEGFTIEFYGAPAPVKTDSRGYFEINNTIPIGSSTYHVKISKPGFLTRMVEVPQKLDMQVSTADAPLLMWAGDVTIKGVQDKAINMTDIMEVAKAFNSTAGSSNYIDELDFNKDKAINMTDIVIVAKHFNSSIQSYDK